MKVPVGHTDFSSRHCLVTKCSVCEIDSIKEVFGNYLLCKECDQRNRIFAVSERLNRLENMLKRDSCVKPNILYFKFLNCPSKITETEVKCRFDHKILEISDMVEQVTIMP